MSRLGHDDALGGNEAFETNHINVDTIRVAASEQNRTAHGRHYRHVDARCSVESRYKLCSEGLDVLARGGQSDCRKIPTRSTKGSHKGKRPKVSGGLRVCVIKATKAMIGTKRLGVFGVANDARTDAPGGTEVPVARCNPKVDHPRVCVCRDATDCAAGIQQDTRPASVRKVDNACRVDKLSGCGVNVRDDHELNRVVHNVFEGVHVQTAIRHDGRFFNNTQKFGCIDGNAVVDDLVMCLHVHRSHNGLDGLCGTSLRKENVCGIVLCQGSDFMVSNVDTADGFCLKHVAAVHFSLEVKLSLCRVNSGLRLERLHGVEVYTCWPIIIAARRGQTGCVGSNGLYVHPARHGGGNGACARTLRPTSVCCSLVPDLSTLFPCALHNNKTR
eukprot:m.40144 g.40144  ORF g.40144 m.40144 type:complete len:387 (-) comp5920_c0_seq1:271-1431(-)